MTPEQKRDSRLAHATALSTELGVTIDEANLTASGYRLSPSSTALFGTTTAAIICEIVTITAEGKDKNRQKLRVRHEDYIVNVPFDLCGEPVAGVYTLPAGSYQVWVVATEQTRGDKKVPVPTFAFGTTLVKPSNSTIVANRL